MAAEFPAKMFQQSPNIMYHHLMGLTMAGLYATTLKMRQPGFYHSSSWKDSSSQLTFKYVKTSTFIDLGANS
jgi:hypothetical protein